MTIGQRGSASRAKQGVSGAGRGRRDAFPSNQMIRPADTRLTDAARVLHDDLLANHNADGAAIHNACSASASDSPSHITDVLMAFCQGGEETAEFERKIIEGFLKRLKGKEIELEALIQAVTSNGKTPTRCVTIFKRSLDGRVNFAGRKVVPPLESARIWRWPNVAKKELSKLSMCRYMPEDENHWCINPYHYERVMSNAGRMMKCAITKKAKREESVDDFLDDEEEDLMSESEMEELGLSDNEVRKRKKPAIGAPGMPGNLPPPPSAFRGGRGGGPPPFSGGFRGGFNGGSVGRGGGRDWKTDKDRGWSHGGEGRGEWGDDDGGYYGGGDPPRTLFDDYPPPHRGGMGGGPSPMRGGRGRGGGGPPPMRGGRGRGGPPPPRGGGGGGTGPFGRMGVGWPEPLDMQAIPKEQQAQQAAAGVSRGAAGFGSQLPPSMGGAPRASTPVAGALDIRPLPQRPDERQKRMEMPDNAADLAEFLKDALLSGEGFMGDPTIRSMPKAAQERIQKMIPGPVAREVRPMPLMALKPAPPPGFTGGVKKTSSSSTDAIPKPLPVALEQHANYEEELGWEGIETRSSIEAPPRLKLIRTREMEPYFYAVDPASPVSVCKSHRLETGDPYVVIPDLSVRLPPDAVAAVMIKMFASPPQYVHGHWGATITTTRVEMLSLPEETDVMQLIQAGFNLEEKAEEITVPTIVEMDE